MGWETRQRGGWYYTRSVRVGGKVKRVYVGTGELGELAARTDAMRRAERATRRDRLRGIDALIAQLDAYCQAIETEVQAQLRRAGWHQHKRGEWRRARHGKAEGAAAD